MGSPVLSTTRAGGGISTYATVVAMIVGVQVLPGAWSFVPQLGTAKLPSPSPPQSSWAHSCSRVLPAGRIVKWGCRHCNRQGLVTPTASLTAAGGAAASTAAAAAAAAATSATAATAVATSTVVTATSTPAVSSAAATGILSSLVDSVAHAAPLLGSLGVFTMVIALHEAGHLVAALSQGIRVKSFSIGFGPKLVSYRGLGSREKEAAAAPGSKQAKRGAPSVTGGSGAGGADGSGGSIFSRLSGPSWDWGGGERRSEDDGERDAGKRNSGGRSVGKNAGGNRSAKGTGRRSGSQKNAAATVEDDVDDGVEYALRAIPVGGFVSFPNNYEMAKDGAITEFDDPNLLSNRGPASRAVVVVAGVVANIILAWACIFGSVTTSGVVRPHFAPGVVVTQIADQEGSAASAGFQAKDVLLSINGSPLNGNRESLEKAIGVIRASDGRPLAMEVARGGGKAVTKIVQPSMGNAGKYSIGVRLAPNLESIERQKASSPIEAAGMAVEETVKLTGETVGSLAHFVSSGDAEGMSGPVEIVKIGANVATEDGAGALLQFAAVISVNLAVINALPVPGLDGGQMVFILAELISRRKLDRAVTETINGVALVILLTFGLSTIAGDLGIVELLQRLATGAISARPPSP